jgi:hypothetical protein
MTNENRKHPIWLKLGGKTVECWTIFMKLGPFPRSSIPNAAVSSLNSQWNELIDANVKKDQKFKEKTLYDVFLHDYPTGRFVCTDTFGKGVMTKIRTSKRSILTDLETATDTEMPIEVISYWQAFGFIFRQLLYYIKFQKNRVTLDSSLFFLLTHQLLTN